MTIFQAALKLTKIAVLEYSRLKFHIENDELPYLFNLRPDGVGLLRAPCSFPVCQTRRFCLRHHYSFLPHVQNFEFCVGSGQDQVIRSGQVTSPPKTFAVVSRPQRTK